MKRPASGEPAGHGLGATDLLPRLRRALAGRYTIERELGRGGMAVVFLALDPKHQRRVAVKVLRPELAAGLGPDRFLREIQIGASLTHPHILPLYDSGSSGGFLYYVMPYVEGESLRQRLIREKQLSVTEAVRIAGEVAAALGHAHGRGVVHRDIKPENILLSGGEAVVADFGIARAVSAAGEGRLTETGIAVGTPTYMSPEQASGGEADGRSDLYSLGCVLYEMLVGEPPFTGINAQAVMARHFATPVPSVRIVRQAVPEQLEHVIRTALAKTPADRFATAQQFADALAGARMPVRFRLPRLFSRRAALVAAAAAALVIGALALWPRSGGLANPAVVAVVPFRVAGAAPTLAYLREGMIDLLAAKLTGEGGPRATDPRTVMSAWRSTAGSEEGDLSEDAVVALAHRLGAGRVLLGSVVGTPERLVLSATLLGDFGRGDAPQVRVEGPVDSLTGLVDQLAAQLLALGAGEARQRLALATSTSLPALQAYLEGRAAYRRGRYQVAVDHFDRALAADSTFALAALGLRQAGTWIGIGRGGALAWALRDRLGTRDRALLEGLVGPRYPGYSSEREVLMAWERAVAAAPDQPDAWYELGDQLYHSSDLLGVDPTRERTGAAMERAVALDSTFSAPLGHLVELAAHRGDPAAVRWFGALYLRQDSAADVADYIRWRIAAALGDEATLARLRARLPTMSAESQRRLVVTSELDGVPSPDVERAAELWLAGSDAALSRWFTVLRLHDLFLNRGDPARALAFTDSLRALRPQSRAHLRMRVEDAVYSDGDSAAGGRAAAGLSRYADGALAVDVDQRAEQYADACTLEQWRLHHGDSRRTRAAIARLRAASPERDSLETYMFNGWCAIALEAMLGIAERRPDARASLARFDSLMLGGPRPLETSRSILYRNFQAANLALARLHEAAGDNVSALAAVRRRPYHGGGTVHLSSFLRTEGRLAALAGDRAGAIRAYRHYLTLRPAPAAVLVPDVAQVQAEVARLTGS